MVRQAIQLAPRSPVYFYCFYNWIKTHWKSRQILKEPIFWPFSEKTHEKSSLGVETFITIHCCTFFFNCFSIQMICITLRPAEGAKFERNQKFIWKFIFLHKKIWAKTFWKVGKLWAKNLMQLMYAILSHNQLWDAINGMLGQRSATKEHLPAGKVRFSVVFAKNSQAKIFRLPKKFGCGHYYLANSAKQSANWSYQCVPWK